MTYPRTYSNRFTVALLTALALASTTASSDAKARARTPRVKNVVLLIGDGMQLEHEIATSRYLRGSDYAMLWHWAWFRSPVSTWDVTTQVRKASNHVCPTGEYCGAFRYPDREVTYGTGHHTNELVMLYAYGQGISEIRRQAGKRSVRAPSPWIACSSSNASVS